MRGSINSPNKPALILAACLFFIIFPEFAFADTLYLKNGRNIEGIIKNEDADSLKLDIGIGTVGFRKTEIDRIIRSDSEEQDALRQKMDKQKEEADKRYKKSQKSFDGESEKSRAIDMASESGHIFVDAMINGKAKVRLLMDTGASVMVLPNRIGRQLGLSKNEAKNMIQLQLGDGRKVGAQYVLLESVDVQGAVARDVGAAIFMDDSATEVLGDGILGMSFLGKFNFKVDQGQRKLTLERSR